MKPEKRSARGRPSTGPDHAAVPAAGQPAVPPAEEAPGTEASGTPEAPARSRTWSFSTTCGYTATGYLPPWAQDDPSESGLTMDQLSMRLSDLAHTTAFPGQNLRVWSAPHYGDKGYQPYDEEILRGMITCNVFDEEPERRLPVANIEVIDDHMLECLGPAEVTDLVTKLRAQADRLEDHVLPTLIHAREDWARHHNNP